MSEANEEPCSEGNSFSLEQYLPESVFVDEKIEIISGVGDEGHFFTWSTNGRNLTQTLGMLFRAGLDAYMVSYGGLCGCDCEGDEPEGDCECDCHNDDEE